MQRTLSALLSAPYVPNQPCSINMRAWVGIPYVPRGRTRAGFDCWGICLAFALDELGLALPEYFYDEAHILEHAVEHIRRATEQAAHWTRVEEVQRGDILIFRIMGFETHCGIALGNGDFLHSLEGRASCVESLSHSNWEHRCTGAYRWTMR